MPTIGTPTLRGNTGNAYAEDSYRSAANCACRVPVRVDVTIDARGSGLHNQPVTAALVPSACLCRSQHSFGVQERSPTVPARAARSNRARETGGDG